jgi:hypothetical protein
MKVKITSTHTFNFDFYTIDYVNSYVKESLLIEGHKIILLNPFRLVYNTLLL